MNKWTRRGLITAGVIGGSALLVGVGIRPGNRVAKVKSLITNESEDVISSWVKVDQNNIVTAIVPHAEMGQGTHTALAQMLADEMDVAWENVRVEEAPAHEEYANFSLAKGFLTGSVEIPRVLMGTVDGMFFQLSKLFDLQITGGSTSVRLTGNHGARVAGAAAKEMLLDAAAEEWDVSPNQLTLEQGYIRDLSGDRVEPIATFAATAGTRVPPAKPKLKQPSDFQLIGKSMPRLDIPSKVDGTATFAIDVNLPEMKCAAIRHAPVFGSHVVRLDHSDEIDVVDLHTAVAVISDSYWKAENLLGQVKIEWSKTPHDSISDQQILEQFNTALTATGAEFNEDHSAGDVASALASASSQIDATYFAPNLAHAPMEPLNSTAHVTEDHCEVWTGSQNPLGLRSAVAEALDLDASQVVIHNCYLGGAFGRRVSHDFAIESAKISKHANAPIKLIWSRAQDLQNDQYRTAVSSRFVGGTGEDQLPSVWTNKYVNKHEPAEAPLIPYAIPNQEIASVASPIHIPFGVWRSVDHSQHAFFTESFIDELAALSNSDPLEYRLKLLGHLPRYQRLLEKVRDMIDWKFEDFSKSSGRGLGVAIVKSFGSIAAQAVQVTVNNDELKIDKICCAVDPGFAVNPDGFKAQIEGGIIYGLTAALYGEINVENGRVKQSNFHDYPIARFDEVPEISTEIINGGGPMGGAGEPGTPPIAPALTNAVYVATGNRIRKLPIFNLQSGRKLSRTQTVT